MDVARYCACVVYVSAILCMNMINSLRFKYPPYWVPVSRLWDSMAEDDTQTNCPRGFFVVRSANNDSSKHSCAT